MSIVGRVSDPHLMDDDPASTFRSIPQVGNSCLFLGFDDKCDYMVMIQLIATDAVDQ